MGSRGFLQINYEVDIWMSGVEIMQKPINISNPFLFKVTHENVANKSKSLSTRRGKERGSGREYN